MKNYNTGIAAEYFIISQLFRQGLEAYVTLGNKKSIDIRIITQTGRPLSLDVKAVRGYGSLIVNNIEKVANHFIALLIYNNKFEDVSSFPEVYIVPSMEIAEFITFYKEEARITSKTSILKYRDRWDLFL